ncbi:MAG: response regulator [Alphaproteobacteria bacterium]|jgi:signal transduction histidine kinase|nr:response regulator [Alphaproteobacteria bacterium]
MAASLEETMIQAVKYNEQAASPKESAIDPNAVNILIVDDLPEKIMVYRAILEDLQHNLITAQSGEEALKLVLKHEFAVILLDVNMPGVDGFETATLIRSRKKSSKTPIIFLTAFNDDFNVAQGYASGAVDYLPTPVVPEVLRAKIKVFIELFQMRQQAAVQAEERAKREAAEESDRRKDEFLAILAHELRNPLAPLQNALNLLKIPDLKPDMTAAAHKMMNRQLQHMVRLVDDLMDVSRITRGKIDLHMESVSLMDVIESAVETAKPLINDKNHTIEIETPKKPILVRADFVRLSQVFSNLLNNAAKYMDHGGLINVTMEQSNNYVLIHVKDTGIGIAPEKLPMVFDLFTQVDSSLTRSEGGLGIGLTLVKSLVEMQKGIVEARSDGLNSGSTFTVTLPITKQKSNVTPFKGNGAAQVKKPLRILIVDDNQDSAQTLGWMLEMEGHQVFLKFNGPDAIEMARQINPEVVLLDIGLPDMNGYEICRIMQEQLNLAEAVFIAQTGWGQEEHRRRSKEAGFHHHLVKPVAASDLYEIVNSRKNPHI